MRDPFQIGHVQGKHSTHCAIPNPESDFLVQAVLRPARKEISLELPEARSKRNDMYPVERHRGLLHNQRP